MNLSQANSTSSILEVHSLYSKCYFLFFASVYTQLESISKVKLLSEESVDCDNTSLVAPQEPALSRHLKLIIKK